ncbi:sigma-70 family RNA polymerase sigma factor [Luteolibacter ambystomatis]|uniref:Sigma-70 family RNA polymerase sigma factor n=1 Tax=Luteolibacter ambystomatis TaxID=2824561 RepID=A0A975J2V4_9BACT|nr:sigma-70 family RNA polymerase sigma factor [Luteolibacter ambystomatis]QUE53030.1 sigma-70 family RNA polymerase sigma factor [Luteolibacter ambystomatis]
MNTDADDLREYVAHASEPAFRRIVERHVAMVHGVARRATRDLALAEEITQSVFILLARKAGGVPSGHLSGWLHRATTGECRNAIRKEARRNRLHQQYADAMNNENTPAGQWRRIAPYLDQAVGRLSAADRELVLLRYFEDRTFQEIAAATGRSVEACKKGSQRALERLGGHLQKQGVTVAGATLAPALSFGALPPVTLSAATISSTAVGVAAASSGSAAGFFGFVQLMTTKQITVGAILLIALAAIPIVRMTSHQAEKKAPPGSSVASTSDAGPSSAARKAVATGRPQEVKTSINWAEIARTKFNSRNEAVLERETQELAELLKGMSNEELDKAMDEITALDISLKQKMALREVLIAELSGRDPMLVLNRLPKDKDKPMLVIPMSGAFRMLLENDPAAADAWVKRQVAEGNLSDTPTGPGEPMDRFLFEAYILKKQAESDPAGAVQRIMGTPDSQRANLLMSAADYKFPSAFDLAMDYYTRSGDDSLVNRLMDSYEVVRGVHFEEGVGLEQMHKLADRMPDANARAAAHAKLDEVAKEKPEGVPLELLLEGDK